MAYRVVSADLALVAAAVRSIGRDRTIVNDGLVLTVIADARVLSICRANISAAA
jgi:hypothetical protein